jgi:hypothetical protein
MRLSALENRAPIADGALGSRRYRLSIEHDPAHQPIHASAPIENNSAITVLDPGKAYQIA